MPRKPVVFIPGYPASELFQKSKNRTIFPPDLGDLLDPQKRSALVALLAGPDNPPGDIVAGPPIRDLLGIAKQAQSLYDILRSSRYGYTIDTGDNFRAAGWDWRQAVDAQAVQAGVLKAISDLRQASGGAKVVVIAHSTGSLVLRRLLETSPEAAQSIEQVIAFGATWAGIIYAIRALVNGQSIGFWPARLTAADVRAVVRSTQAAYDLFPPDPAKTRLFDLAGNPLGLFVDDTPQHQQIGPLVDLRWAPSGSRALVQQHAADADRRLGARTSDIRIPGGVPTPPITNVVGWGMATDTSCEMAADGSLSFKSSKQGDGTAAAASASWLRGPSARTFFLPIGIYPTSGIPTIHNRIWDAPPVLEIFDQVLLDHAPAPFVCAAADPDQMIDSGSDVTLRLSASDGQGGALPGAQVLLRGISPQPLSLAGHVRVDAIIPRAAIRPDPQRLFRFVAEVSWTVPGGRETREVVVILKS
jgi:pimeloyl-ACP methyl ester carboxylesterase